MDAYQGVNIRIFPEYPAAGTGTARKKRAGWEPQAASLFFRVDGYFDRGMTLTATLGGWQARPPMAETPPDLLPAGGCFGRTSAII